MTASNRMTDCEEWSFVYDVADRLTKVRENNHDIMEMTYAQNGNIFTKNNMGQYSYNSTSMPHAVSSISPVDGIPEYEQYIEYNPWNKAEDIYHEEGDDYYYYHIEYGPDQQRVRSSLYKNGVLQNKKFYWDDYEEYLYKNDFNNDVTVWSYWIEAPDGLAGFFWNTTAEYYTVLHPYVAMTDHLGSLTGLYDQNGNKTLDATYDAWGKRTFAAGSMQLDRGFTGHEHIDALGLINMNGRMYDPRQGRFLSPDNYIQAPNNPQNYNRYSYCLNNPLKYTDPSGEFAWIPVLIGAAFGGYSGYKIAELNGLNFENVQTYGYILGGAVLGGLSGLLGASAASSNFLPCTLSNMVGSSASSLSMSALSGGQMTPSVNFGFASLDFGSKKIYSFGNSRSLLESIGYGFGALGNLSDILAGRNAGVITGRVENDPNSSIQIFNNDAVSHYQLSYGIDPLIDWGPSREGIGTNSYELERTQFAEDYISRYMSEGLSYEQALAKLEQNHIHFYQDGLVTNLKGGRFWDPISITHVNVDRVRDFGNFINGRFNYHLYTNNCVNMASRALNISGVPNIGIHPYLLHAQMYLRSIGIRPCLYSYYGSLVK